MSYRNKILGNSFFYGLAGYQETIFGMFISVLVARQLGAEDYGLYSLIMWFVALGVMLVSGGVVTSIIKFVAEQKTEQEQRSIPSIIQYSLRILYLKFPLSLVIIVILLLLIENRLPTGDKKLLFWIALLAILPKALQGFYTSVLKGKEDFKSIFWLNIIVTPINLLAVIFVVWRNGDIFQFVYLYLGVTIAYFIVSRYFAKKAINKTGVGAVTSLASLDKASMNRQIRFLYLTALLGFFIDKQMEVFFLNMLATPEEAGYYNVAFMLSIYTVELIPGLLVGVLLPVMAKSRTESMEIQAYRYREVGRYLMLLTAPVIIFVAAYADLIIEMLYGQDYQASVIPLIVLVLAAGLTPLAGLANSVLVSHEKQKIVLNLILLTALLNILLDYFLIKIFGLTGAIIGFSVIKIGLSVAFLAYASTVVRAKLNYNYYLKVLLLASLAVFPLIFLKTLDYPVFVFLLAGIIFTIIYFVFLVQFKMMTREDVSILRHISDKLPLKSSTLNNHLFSWLKNHQTEGYKGE